MEGKGTQVGGYRRWIGKQRLFFWVIFFALIHIIGGERLRESLDEAIMDKAIQGTRTIKQSGARLEVLKATLCYHIDPLDR